MDKWYKFDSLEAFNAWHEQLKSDLNYPLPSIDKDGNIIGEPFTTDYTSAVKVSDEDFRAMIDEEFADGLTLSEAPKFDDPLVNAHD
jgi:hypothetical protein